jgi:hypothetical protein
MNKKISAFRLPVRLFLATVLSTATSYGILYNDNFSYDGYSGKAASIALAADTATFPVFAAVGQMNYTDGGDEYSATGTLISSEWVLTAAHNWNSGGGVTAMTFTLNGTDYSANLTTLTQHPNWVNAPAPLANETPGFSQGWDVAVFRLTTPVVGITPATIYTGADEFGKTGYTVGFGRIGTGTTVSSENTDNSKLAMANVIDRVTLQNAGGYAGGALDSDFDSGMNPANTLLAEGFPDENGQVLALDPAGTITGTTSLAMQLTVGSDILEGGTAQGDSGGPTFILDGGIYKIAGITSWGHNPANDFATTGLYGDLSAMTRVSANSAWINASIPEPSVTALFLAGLVAFGALRLRRLRRQ